MIVLCCSRRGFISLPPGEPVNSSSPEFNLDASATDQIPLSLEVDKPGLGQVRLSVCAVLSRTLTVRKVILGTGDLSGASLLFGGPVPLISYRPVLWPLYAFGLKIRKKS
jgi:hypothetical protein